ncbi:MAG: hypothetical protein O2840_04000 [bacterium]|nr:hypothetical protein [bacterium]
MSKLVLLIAAVILITLFGFIFFSNSTTAPESSTPSSPQPAPVAATQKTDIQASFAIFTNGTFRIFTASMYHNLSQDAYIEASNPNLVQVTKMGTTWNDFFSTLPFELTATCLTTGTKETFCSGKKGELQFYLNGVKNDNALDQEIANGDRLLVTFGSESEAQIRQQIERIPTIR